MNLLAQVDLAGDQVESIKTQSENPMNQQWFDRFEIGGFASGGYYKTGKDGLLPYGHFNIREASLFFEATVWKDVSMYLEWHALRLASEESKKAGQTGEYYIHLKNLIANKGLSMKVGRMDIPFGEEYLVQDSVDDPLITLSAAWPYGFDEGILLYGDIGAMGWILAAMDGADVRDTDDHPSMSVNAKLYSQMTDWFYASASYMKNGKSAKSAIEFGGSHFEPVTGSLSTEVDSSLWEIDFKLNLGSSDNHLTLSYGGAALDDDDDSFDRDFTWYQAEPLYYLTDKFYLVARYSYVGTGDDLKGYKFDGKPFAGGNAAFDVESKSLTRAAGGVGYWMNPKTVIKLEYSSDDYELITGATSANGGKRNFVGLEIATKF